MKRFLLAAALFLLPMSAFAQSATCPAYSKGWTAIAGTAYTLSPNDQCSLLVFTSSSSVTLTLPVPKALFPFGFEFLEFTKGTGTVTLTAASGTTVNGGSTLAKATGVGALCRSNGANWYCKP
jgi:hypothetical protein